MKRIELTLGLMLFAGAGGTRAQEAAEKTAPVSHADKAGIQWVSIPGGTFTMGLRNGGKTADADLRRAEADEKPAHSVTIKSFQIAKTLVTNKQYKVCVADGACTEPVFMGPFGADDQPVVGVDWNQAKAFSEWAGGRLPTEAEWEYAVRSGGKDQKYPWGDEEATCERAVIDGCGYRCGSGGATAPVCSKPSGNTEQGLCDMAGNVSEWVQDRYHGSYKGAPTDGSAWKGPASSDRVNRGGDCMDGAWFARSAKRSHNEQSDRSVYQGFRIVRATLEKTTRTTPASPTNEESPASMSAGSANTSVGSTSGDVGIQWVSVPGGTFTMGSTDSDIKLSERLIVHSLSIPAHQVIVKPFQMAKTLVTNKQYKVCVDAGSCSPVKNYGSSLNSDDQPVVGVDWDQATAFSKWVGGRLPSEAEWEYAARSAGKDWKYPWGNEGATCERAVVDGCGYQATAPVCSKPAGNTAQGLCDMAGNAWEWVQDRFHDSYNGAPMDGSAWEDSNSIHVIRGGSWDYDAGFARSAFRCNCGPGSHPERLGFRPAR